MRVNPYETLKKEAQEWIRRALNPHRQSMWVYPKDKLGEGWALVDLAERVRAASQLGYRVELVWKDDGLHVEYVKRPPQTPGWY